MLTFLLSEGVLTIGAVSGLFTASLLNSFKINILEPLCERLAPSHELDKHASGFNGLSFLGSGNNNPPGPKNHHIKYQTFMRDFICWIIVIFVLYLAWLFIIKPYKIKTNEFSSK